MRPLSAAARSALQTSHDRFTEVKVQLPGESSWSSLDWDAGTIRAQMGPGTRYSADLTLSQEKAADTFGLVTTPGALFKIIQGVDFGLEKEPIDVFTGVLATAPKMSIFGGNIDLSLTDRWSRLESCRYLEPYQPVAGTRSSVVSATVLDAIPGQTFNISTDGGNYTGSSVWDRDRIQLITDMSTDGAVETGFDAAGDFIFREVPILAQENAVWTFRSGERSNILSATRSVPFNRLYNTVVVKPANEDQNWAQVVVSIEDPNHPRHPSKIGIIPYFWASPTITNQIAARQAGSAILQRVLGQTSVLQITTVSNPALEPGDVVIALQEPTDVDPGFRETHLIESFVTDLKTFQMEASTRSSTLTDLEEAA